jgi:hypothetical protein
MGQCPDRRIHMLVEKRKPMTSYAKAVILGLALFAAVAGLASCNNPIVEAVDDLRVDAVSPRIVLSLADNSSLASGGTAGFGQISSGTNAFLSIAVGNEGKSALAVDVAGITLTLANGTEDGTFSIASLPAATIATGSFSTLSIAFSPSSTGPKSALVSIPTNDTKNPAFSFTISGSGSSLVISTAMASAITTVSATGGGNITFNGGLAVTSRGICWGSTPYPTVADHTSSDGSNGDGEYTSAMNGLTAGSLYYARAWAATSAGITYGPQVSFTTLPDAPASPSVSALPYADGSGKLSVSWPAVYGSGICYDIYCSTTATRPGSARLSGLSGLSCTLEGLIDYTNYYVWVVARNATGPGADSPTMGSPVMVGVKVSSITLSKSSAIFLVGSSETVTATCLPATATQSGVTWSSSAPDIATVSGGVVTGGTTAGTATIKAEAVDGQGTSVNFTATTKAFLRNDVGPAGGILFYDKLSYSDGWRYMEAAPVNVGAGHAWSPKAYSVNIPGAFGTGIGPGLDNSHAINNAFGSGTYLAKDCLDYSLNGYSDWFMPSDTEAANVIWYVLGASYSSLAYFVSSTQNGNGIGNGCNAYYCSSTSPCWTSISVTLSGSGIVTRPVRRF